MSNIDGLTEIVRVGGLIYSGSRGLVDGAYYSISCQSTHGCNGHLLSTILDAGECYLLVHILFRCIESKH